MARAVYIVTMSVYATSVAVTFIFPSIDPVSLHSLAYIHTNLRTKYKRCIFGEMRTRVAMFRSETELAQLELIFQVTGYPQGEALKQYEAIEQWHAFRHIQNNAQNCFLAKYGSGKNKYFDAVGLDLLQRLLDIDPSRRISAEDALAHAFFRDPVLPEQ